MLPDFDTCYRAVQARDPRFDGWFFTGVRTTGVYCRPSCPAMTPRARNVVFHPSAAAAQRAGLRACRRCRPDATPGSPEWNARADLAGRALRLIADGLVDRAGVDGLAARLGYSARQLNRTLVAEVGAGPLALARAQRAQTARILLETTDLPATDVAFAAGFASVRQFNDTVRAVFATTPTGLRATGAGRVAARGVVELRLAYRRPMNPRATIAFLAARAVSGIEAISGDTATRVLDLPGGPGLAEVSPHPAPVAALSCRLRLTDVRDLTAAVARIRRLFDLDADPVAVDAVLSAGGLRASVQRAPGTRSPGAVDGFELAVRAVVGHQLSPAAARAALADIVTRHGRPAFDDHPWRIFPGPAQLADTDDLPLPAAGRATIRALARAAVHGLTLDPGADRSATRSALLDLPGVGPSVADRILQRALGDPDVLIATDPTVRRAARRLGVDLTRSERWAPWRSYAMQHIRYAGAATSTEGHD